jgi:hypothetical protein
MEAKSEAMLKECTNSWDDLIDFEIIPVLTSEQAAKSITPEL